MKQSCLTTIIAVFLFFCTIGIQAQTTETKRNQVYLDNTEQFTITSKFVADENYIIQVGLPYGYSSSKNSYPVLYVLDGDVSFGMTKDIADLLMFTKEIKDILIVSINYRQGRDIWWNKRARDYTHCSDTIVAKGRFQNAGGAQNFLMFIKDELIPVVNNKYRTLQNSTAIMGLSFGGMLNSFILFTQSELFNGYIIIAPSLVWNDKSILKLEAEYYNRHKELNKTVYIAYGSLDDKVWINNPTNEFIQTIKTHNFEGLKLYPQIFEGETHISVYPAAVSNGLRTIFKR